MEKYTKKIFFRMCSNEEIKEKLMFNYPKWKIVLIGIISALGVFFCVPNFLPQAQQEKLPEWWKPLTLGLDLQGGSQLLLQVNLDQVVKDQMGAVQDAVRNTLREKGIRYTGLTQEGDKLKVRIVNDNDILKAKDLIRKTDKGNLDVSEKEDELTVSFTEIFLPPRE